MTLLIFFAMILKSASCNCTEKVVQVQSEHCHVSGDEVCTNSIPSKSEHEAERSEDKGENDHGK